MTNAAHIGEPRLPANRYPGLENLIGSIITDCGDDNARMRQEANFQNLFGVQPTFRNLGGHSPDLQAAGNIADVISASAPVGNFPASPLVALVNVAPRGDEIRKRHKNGTPFGHVKVGNAHIFSTVEGSALALLERLGLASEVEVYDIPTVAEYLIAKGALSKREAREITETQFRSLETLPKIAYEVVTGSNMAYETRPIVPRPEVAGRAYEIDNFGNIKIAATPKEVGFKTGKKIKIVGTSAVRCVEHLTDVPQDGKLTLIKGSSGPKPRHFVELVVQRGRASDELAGKLDGKTVQVGQQIIDLSKVS